MRYNLKKQRAEEDSNEEGQQQIQSPIAETLSKWRFEINHTNVNNAKKRISIQN